MRRGRKKGATYLRLFFFGFARLRFRGRTLGFFGIVATIMIPIQVLMIPTYVLFSRVGLIDSLGAAIVPWLASAFGIFLMRQFFLSLPKELEEAARLDGCSPYGVFWRIVLPLAKPALAKDWVKTDLLDEAKKSLNVK